MKYLLALILLTAFSAHAQQARYITAEKIQACSDFGKEANNRDFPGLYGRYCLKVAKVSPYLTVEGIRACIEFGNQNENRDFPGLAHIRCLDMVAGIKQ